MDERSEANIVCSTSIEKDECNLMWMPDVSWVDEERIWCVFALLVVFENYIVKPL